MAALPPLKGPTPTLDSTFGAMFIGNLLAAVLYGVTNVQTFNYFCDVAKKDHLLLKCAIAALWVLSTLHLTFGTIQVYQYLITNYGDYVSLLGISKALQAHIAISAISDLITRSVLIHRVHAFTQCVWFSAVLMFLNITGAGAGLAYAIIYGGLANSLEVRTIMRLNYLDYGLGVGVDVSITAALCWRIADYRSRTISRSTNHVLSGIMIYTINTGCLVCLCTLAEVIASAIMPDNMIFQAIYFCISPLFQNALLATLNARRKWRQHTLAENITIPLTMSDGRTGVSASHFHPDSDDKGERSQVLSIRVERATEVTVDDHDDPKKSHVFRSVGTGFPNV